MADTAIENEDKGRLKTYQVYKHPNRITTVVVKEGWSWGAFIFGPWWFLVNRMWLNFIIYGGLVLGVNAVLDMGWPRSWGGAAALFAVGALSLVGWYCLGRFGNAILASELEHDGYKLQARVMARNAAYAREEASIHAAKLEAAQVHQPVQD